MKKIFLILLMWNSLCTALGQSKEFQEAQTAATNYKNLLGYQYDAKRNIFIDQNHVIHIFLFEDGNLLLGGYPTTATEKDKFQVHLFVQSTNNATYLLSYTGSFTPSLNIENGNFTASLSPAPVPVHFAILGPFTNTLQLTLKRDDSGTYNTVASTTITIAKTIHVSIGSGLLYSTLKNPNNIKIHVLENGDTTLLADDNDGRGMLTLFATFYPGGRANLFIPSKKFLDHFGITVGTAINSGTASFRDMFLGGQYDFSAGGSFVLGMHYGRRQTIQDVDYKEFEFGKSKFSGDLEVKKMQKWDLGFFIGIQVDSRIFSQLFK